MKFTQLTLIASAVLSLAAFSTTASAQSDAKASLVQAQTNGTIQSIEQAEKEGGVSVLRIRMNQPLKGDVSGFMVSNPSRVAIDLPVRVENAGPKLVEFSSGFAKSASVIQNDKKTRLVISLNKNVSYETTKDGNDLLVTFKSVDAQAVKPMESGKKFAEGDAAVEHALSAFDFRRGPAGEGRVIVDLMDTSTGIDIKQQDGRIVVDFINADVPAALSKLMNVSDFGTVVNSVSIKKGARGARMVIEPKGEWEYNAYQAEKRFVVEVKKKVEQANSDSAGNLVNSAQANYTGEKMSMNFQNVDVRNLLNVIADFTKLNIVTSDSVSGKLTVRLQDVPWDQALDIVLNTRGLDMRRKGSVIWVAPRDEIAKLEKQVLESQASLVEIEPTRTESFQLNYSQATEVAALLGNANQRILSKRGSVVIDNRTNQLFVQDTSAKLEEVAGIIKKLDIPVRQVQIEARIVEARDSFGISLGARLGVFNSEAGKLLGQNAVYGATPYSMASGVTAGSIANTPGNAVYGTETVLNQVNLPASGLGTGASPSTFALTLLNSAATQFLSLEISAAEADGRGKIVSSPRVITGNQQKALIEQGTELPYQQASASGATNVAFKKANLKLEVTPQITPDGNVIMDVDINKDSPGTNTTAGFAIDTKHVKTNVLIENGGTIVIGGIYTQDERSSVDKVPFLGDLPVLGNMFRSTLKSDAKTELLIFLTPRILDSKAPVNK
jgi:type IV pilus assembly protein PilQ